MQEIKPATSQKVEIFITSAMRNSNPTPCCFPTFIECWVPAHRNAIYIRAMTSQPEQVSLTDFSM